MKGGTRIAIGVGIGYLLGRTRKMRFALALVGASMAKRSSEVPGALVERGISLLKSSPELTQLTDSVRGELGGAVRSAAVTAASNGIDTLNARLQEGSKLVPAVLGQSSESDSDEDSESDSDEDYDEEDTVSDSGEESADEGGDRDDSATDETDEEGTEESAARPRRRGTTRTRKTGSRAPVRRSGSADRKAASSTRRRSRSDADEAPVRRTGR
ncbi:hypothetical protein [Nocardia stercoris]|uniref:hypothetical protein n=1 Tax=Nocardia stercoris TaxID=2483361 RepID=UPI0011C49C39|nr:hypothetical protein [Nocardia stercoris]